MSIFYDKLFVSFIPRLCFQDVFLMIQRRKLTIFLDAKESTPVIELKKMIQGIIKRPFEDIKLFKGDTVSKNVQSKYRLFRMHCISNFQQKSTILLINATSIF